MPKPHATADFASGYRVIPAAGYGHYFSDAERRSRTQTTVIQSVLMLGWILSFLWSPTNIRSRPWQDATLFTGLLGSMLLTCRAPRLRWRLLARLLFEILIAQAVMLMAPSSVNSVFWVVAACSVMMMGIAPLHHEPLSYSFCALMVCTIFLLPHAPEIANSTDISWIFQLLVFSFLLGLILNTLYFMDRIRWFETHGRLLELASKDGLTGLQNRRALISEMEARLRDPEAPERYFLLIDIDDFKKVNDVHGHGAGDEVLQAVARRIGGFTDPCLSGRLGGEEFGMLFEGSQDLARQMAAQIVKSFSTQSVGEHRVTVSIGVARHRPGMTPAQWMNAADRALYEVKRHGKNGFSLSFGQSYQFTKVKF